MQTYQGRRVAFLHHQFTLGGSERVSYSAACYLEGLGIESYFFAHRFDTERWLGSGAKLFPMIELPAAGKNSAFAPENVPVLIEHIRKERIEVLFVGVPDKRLPKEVQQATGCKVVLWLHSVPYHEAIVKIESRRTQGERSWGNRLMWELFHRPRLLWGNRHIKYWQGLYRDKLATYDATLVLVEGFREQLIHELKLPEELARKIFVKTNCLELATNPQLRKKKQIIYMGRLSRSDKRIDRLLRVWAMVQDRLPEWELHIYGSGDKEKKFLLPLAERLGLKRCTFKGFAPTPTLVYQEAAIIAMTSSYEGFPLALSEAQNRGVVPISLDSSAGIRAIVGDGAGVLVPMIELERYAEELYRLATDETYYRALQTKSLERRALYDSAVVDAREWQAILAHLFPNPA